MATQDAVLETASCNLCGETRAVTIYSLPEIGGRMPGRFDIVRCVGCGLSYLSPRPSRETIVLYYPDDYYTFQTPPPPGMRDRLRRSAWESAPGYHLDGGLAYKIAGRSVGALIRTQVDIVLPHIKEGKVLDVGCGNGRMLGWLSHRGWRVYGVDLSEDACRHAALEGIETFAGELEEASYPGDFFDAIVVNHVLEHMYDPLAILEECRRILKPGGLLAVGVPNFGCADRERFGPYWVSLDTPRHLHHFTQESLGSLIEKAGLRVERWKFKIPKALDKVSLGHRIRQRGEGWLGGTLRLVLWAYLVKPVSYLLCSERGPRFSATLAVYARKD